MGISTLNSFQTLINDISCISNEIAPSGLFYKKNDRRLANLELTSLIKEATGVHHNTSLIISQVMDWYCQQPISLANVDPDLCDYIVSRAT